MRFSSTIATELSFQLTLPPQQRDWLLLERHIWSSSCTDQGNRNSVGESSILIAGVDEAGRGPIAGPVVAAAVMLQEGVDIPGVVDSKAIESRRREELYDEIIRSASAVGICAASARVIDRIGIVPAVFSAMTGALRRLAIKPNYVLVDGPIYIPPEFFHLAGFQTALAGEPVIKGDGLSRSIAAASILAKVTRDRLLCNLGRFYPQYGFEQHKGYLTANHQQQLERFGPTCHHRMSFAPLREPALKFSE